MAHKIEKLKGDSKSFYLTIAPVTMSREGVRYFDNYPVVTSKNHTWYTLFDDAELIAFLAVEQEKTRLSIKTFYAPEAGKRSQLLSTLLKEVLSDFKNSELPSIHGYSKTEDLQIWVKAGFEITKQGKNWNNVIKNK